MNMPTETFLTTLYTIVDDWYHNHAPASILGRVGKKPLFSDSEVMTLSLAQPWLGIEEEREFLRYTRHNFLPLFPRLVTQGQFNRRARGLCWLLNTLRQHLVEEMGRGGVPCLLIDGTPVHVRHWRRFGAGHLLLPEAALGYCASKKETFYGFRLLALATPDGVVVGWDLFAANADEREGATELLDNCRHLSVLGDKGFLDAKRQGFLDAKRQALLEEDRGLLLLTPKRKNQKEQNAPGWDALMNRARRVIETAFAQAKGVFGLEKPGARTVWGILSRVIAKITGLTLAAKCNREQGHSPLRLAEFSF